MRFLKQIFIAVFFIFGFTSKLVASFTPKQIQKGLDIALKEVRTHYKPISIFESDYLLFGDSMIINPIGTHYIFLYMKGDDHLTRLDKSNFHGHNFGRSLYKYENQIYAFGGYGFWNSHSKLIKYNWTDREWDLVYLKGQLPDRSPILSFIDGDSLFALFQFNPNEHKQDSFELLKFYVVNLKTLQASRIDYTQKNEFMSNLFQYQSIGTKKWIIWGVNHMILHIYNKQTKEMYVNFSGPWPFRGKSGEGQHRDYNWLLIEDDNIQIISQGEILDNININQYVQLYCKKIGDFNRLNPYIEDEYRNDGENAYKKWTFALVLVVVLIISSIIFLTVKKKISIGEGKKKVDNYYSELNDHEYNFDSLFQLYFGVYTEKELDIALKIYHLPKDIRVLKRSQMLFALNKLKPGFIERKIHPKHSDQFIYEIKNF